MVSPACIEKDEARAYRCNALRPETHVLVLLPLFGACRRGPIREDASIDDGLRTNELGFNTPIPPKTYMGNMNILLRKLLRQALRQCPCPELTRRKRARHHVPAQARRRTREDERAALAVFRVNAIVFEREDRPAGEGECGGDARLEAALHVLGSQVKEGLPCALRGVVHRGADNVLGFREFGVDRSPCGSDVVVRVRGYGKGGGLVSSKSVSSRNKWSKLETPYFSPCAINLSSNLLEGICASSKKSDAVTVLCEQSSKQYH